MEGRASKAWIAGGNSAASALLGALVCAKTSGWDLIASLTMGSMTSILEPPFLHFLVRFSSGWNVSPVLKVHSNSSLNRFVCSELHYSPQESPSSRHSTYYGLHILHSWHREEKITGGGQVSKDSCKWYG